MISQSSLPHRGARAVSRRQWLKASLLAGAAVPLLDAERLLGQSSTGEPIRRFVVFYTPNGTLNSRWWPQGSESDFTLGELTQPLEAFKSKLLFLKGINLDSVLSSNNGSEHARGIGGLLTGRPLLRGNFMSFNNNSAGWASGISLDQHLVNTLNPPTPFKSLELGVQVRDAEVRGRVSYREADQPVPPREDPYEVFDALFGDAAGGDVAGDPLVARLRAQRKSIFDASLEELASLRAQLGVEDRVKLDAHADAIRSIEERLAGAMPAGTGSAECAAPDPGTVLDLNDDNNMPALGQLQMDMAAAALACDQTRILTIQWSYAESEHLYPFLGLNRNHHDISHQWDDPGMDMYSQIQTWYAEQLAYFLGKLDSYQEGDGTLLDNTVVLWGTEIGESTQHALTQMPYMLAGGAGGRLNTGRLIDFEQGRTNNDMLLSIAHAMGTEDTTFGDPDFSTGPLTGLT